MADKNIEDEIMEFVDDFNPFKKSYRKSEVPKYSDLYDWDNYKHGINLKTINKLRRLGFHVDIEDYTRLPQLVIFTDDGNYLKIASVNEFGVYLVEFGNLKWRSVYKRMLYPYEILENKKPIGIIVNGKAHLYDFEET